MEGYIIIIKIIFDKRFLYFENGVKWSFERKHFF